jgi:hypothetical protein
VKLGGGAAPVGKHCVVECIPLPEHVAEDAPMVWLRV